MVNYEEFDHIFFGTKPTCDKCEFITSLGYCKLKKKHQNYILKCEIEEQRIKDKKQLESAN
jgi:hypothetical protein